MARIFKSTIYPTHSILLAVLLMVKLATSSPISSAPAEGYYGVYICTEPWYKGNCIHSYPPLLPTSSYVFPDAPAPDLLKTVCQLVPHSTLISGPDANIISFGPDLYVRCRVFVDETCDLESGFLEYNKPGQSYLAVWDFKPLEPAGAQKGFRSYACWEIK